MKSKTVLLAAACAIVGFFEANVLAEDKETEGLKTESVSQGAAGAGGNQPKRVAWFEDQALGMFIHWGVDCPLGAVVSHHLVGSSKDYQDRFFTQMPGFFIQKILIRATGRGSRSWPG